MVQSKNYLLTGATLNGRHAVIQAGTMPFFGLKKKPASGAGFQTGDKARHSGFLPGITEPCGAFPTASCLSSFCGVRAAGPYTPEVRPS